MADLTRRLPPGWHTDIAVLRLGGSVVEEHADHLVVRSPANPTYHWGNLVLVTDPAAVDDAERWTAVFATAFPDAAHVAIGLVALPTTEPWVRAGLEVETEDVLESDLLPELRPCPEGYLGRPLVSDDDWAQQVTLVICDNEESGAHDPATYPEFARRTAITKRGLVQSGVGAWFGAFHDGELVADLGIVDCGGGVARYRSVGTRSDHRRRGLAGHLLGLAASWARDARGCDHFVILTESDAQSSSGAGRLYRSLGFSPTTPNAQAYRPPPRPPLD